MFTITIPRYATNKRHIAPFSGVTTSQNDKTITYTTAKFYQALLLAQDLGGSERSATPSFSRYSLVLTLRLAMVMTAGVFGLSFSIGDFYLPSEHVSIITGGALFVFLATLIYLIKIKREPEVAYQSFRHNLFKRVGMDYTLITPGPLKRRAFALYVTDAHGLTVASIKETGKCREVYIAPLFFPLGTDIARVKAMFCAEILKDVPEYGA